MKYMIVAGALAGVAFAASSASAGQHGLYGFGGSNFGTGSNLSNHEVSGYMRSNGTYVQGYHATNPNSYRGDNYGARGNVNPYNGQVGTGDQD